MTAGDYPSWLCSSVLVVCTKLVIALIALNMHLSDVIV